MKRLTLLLGFLALAMPQLAMAAEEEDFNPEDEFQLHEWVPIHIGPLDLSINKAVAYLWLGGLITMALGIGLMRLRLRVDPGTRQTLGETLYDITQTQIAEQGLPSKAMGLWFPYVATLFLFIWVLNFIGFIPLPLRTRRSTWAASSSRPGASTPRPRRSR